MRYGYLNHFPDIEVEDVGATNKCIVGLNKSIFKEWFS